MLPPWVGGGLPDGATKGPDELPREEEPSPGEETAPEINPFYRVYRYYSSEKNDEQVKNMKPEEAEEELGKKNTEFRERMEELKQTVSSLEKPDGSKENPARTCRDIKSYYPNKPSGMYWLDPNRGCTSDAILVDCNFAEMEVITCINATENIKNDAWSQKMTHARKWFHEDHNLGAMTYTADMSQLTYLSYLSREAYQTVTIHCKNQVAWFDSVNNNHDKAIHFMGTKRTEFTPIEEKRIMHDVIRDECQHKKQDWDTTILRFKSSKFVRLPIVDMAPVFTADKEAMFGVELGPVCFL